VRFAEGRDSEKRAEGIAGHDGTAQREMTQTDALP
jgi:hypothetical protein